MSNIHFSGASEFVHQTVCHNRNFVDAGIGFHTSAIEILCQECGAYCGRVRGAGRYFQSHLDTIAYRLLK